MQSARVYRVISFRPTRPPAGRLVRLGVVLDTTNRPDRLREVAKMGDRAGVDVLWVADPGASVDDDARIEAWTALTLAGRDTSRARVGAMLDIALRPAAALAAMAGSLDPALGWRLEIGLRGGRMEEYATIFRKLVTREGPGATGRQPAGPPVSVEATDSLEIAMAARVADDVVIPAAAGPDILATVERVREGCEAAGRDPSSLGIAVELPVSIGRTSAEAEARASAAPGFRAVGRASPPALIGTLEQCQDRVIELAHAGVTDLRCIVPNTADVHDVIAQLTAMVVGTVGVLTPSSPRSQAPDPPGGWGDRSSRR